MLLAQSGDIELVIVINREKISKTESMLARVIRLAIDAERTTSRQAEIKTKNVY